MDEINFKCEQRNLFFVEVPSYHVPKKKTKEKRIEKNIVPIK